MAKIPAPGAGPAPTRSSAACTTRSRSLAAAPDSRKRLSLSLHARISGLEGHRKATVDRSGTRAACDDLCVTVHEVAAEGFGSEAEVYERSRPTYPADAVAWVVENLRLQSGTNVADVAAGTGKLTRLLE